MTIYCIPKVRRSRPLRWKAHLLRSVQQDKDRTDVFNTLGEKSVLITQEWAMKFLPQKYRETQADLFGKRGISWYISVVIRKVQDVLQHQTLIHVVQNSSQETDTVTWIMENVLSTLKKDHPDDVCNTFKLYSEGKLTKLNVALLHHFCIFFSMDVDGLSQHRKAPDIYLLSGNWCCRVHALNVKNSIMNFNDQ